METTVSSEVLYWVCFGASIIILIITFVVVRQGQIMSEKSLKIQSLEGLKPQLDAAKSKTEILEQSLKQQDELHRMYINKEEHDHAESRKQMAADYQQALSDFHEVHEITSANWDMCKKQYDELLTDYVTFLYNVTGLNRNEIVKDAERKLRQFQFQSKMDDIIVRNNTRKLREEVSHES